MADVGLDATRIAAAARRTEEIVAYLELHIEQGSCLEQDDLARPFASAAALLAEADRLAQGWQTAELNQALMAHPRIGERAGGADKEARLSRNEQSAMQQANSALKQAMLQGDHDYEQRVGRLFLIRAKGRSGEEMLAELQRRLNNDEKREQQEALSQLREMTVLRLKETME